MAVDIFPGNKSPFPRVFYDLYEIYYYFIHYTGVCVCVSGLRLLAMI